ncbi:MAG: hypothetical protein HN995_03135 [Candidatus Marinimicrobia bacterium]|jgi:hypothetical protein|nr:hypothetical protein [Candidatus Neomarinimicrobiota bacterium]MBT3575236.1 hypothetical protein [Candidatus Neomarinimicrobiota bacterium]MBT3680335.1 hypothetical protein [Candidatus Neomarinimicrobiota bacterium]MBT3951764.1 hypothetical protein [Candidatus Neomarinimicrobiota bacterium]MBT4252802.1 hypothetical protein [Candidatus Neomarinimicrobiota bacterium]
MLTNTPERINFSAILTAVIIYLLSSPVIAGELTYTFDNSVGTADYLLGSKLVPDASYSSSAFSLSSVLSDNSRAYIDISHSQIYPYAEYSSTDAELGLQLRYLDIKDNQIFAGLFAYLSRFHDSYSYYNSSGFGMYLKWKYYLKASQLFISGYDLNFNRFEEVTEASNTDHEIYLTYNQSFNTKTSVNIRTSLAYQNFWPQVVIDDQLPGRFTRAVEVDSIPDNYLIKTELRLSQALGPKLGATLWLNYQTLINEDASALALQDGLNNPFIDRFRSEGPSASLRLLYRMGGRQKLKLIYAFDEKKYRDVPVYEFDFEAMNYVIENDTYSDLGFDRSDKKQKVQVSWSLDLGQDQSAWFSDIEMLVNTGWTQNVSNDPLYDYKSMNYGITLNINN